MIYSFVLLAFVSLFQQTFTGFIIYRLRSVLGKRTGFQKDLSQNKPQQDKKTETKKEIPSLLDNQLKLQEVYKKVADFDHKQFIEGAKKAFEIIITSFNNGDKKNLKNVLINKDEEIFRIICQFSFDLFNGETTLIVFLN